MSNDDRFERDLRSTLDELASEPAPERLVERVATIRGEAAMNRQGGRRGGLSFMRAVYGLAAAAVVVLVAGAVIVSRPGGAGSIFGGPGAAQSPAGGAAATQAAGSSPQPAGSTPEPTATPPATPAAGPAGGPVPSGMQAVSVTFASPDLGWVLGTATCSTPPCTSIVRTSDGGRTWVGIPAPKAALAQPGVPTAGPGVSELRFADALDGWAYGPGLWSTHDGGATWRQLSVPGGPAASVFALEAAYGEAQAVVWDGSSFRVASAPVGRDDWTLSSVKLQPGAGPVPEIQLVLQGRAGWVLENDRTVVTGARLANGTWSSWMPPCANVTGPAVIGASTETELVAACDVGLWSNPKGEHLYVSHDAGATWTELTGTIPVQNASAATAWQPGTVLAAGTTSAGTEIAGSFDAGKTWASVLKLSSGSVFDLGFTTNDQGVAIASPGTGQGVLYMTRDGGHTWSQITFQ